MENWKNHGNNMSEECTTLRNQVTSLTVEKERLQEQTESLKNDQVALNQAFNLDKVQRQNLKLSLIQRNFREIPY